MTKIQRNLFGNKISEDNLIKRINSIKSKIGDSNLLVKMGEKDKTKKGRYINYPRFFNDWSLFKDWMRYSKKAVFEDDLEVKLNYSCIYRIYDWKDLRKKNKESKKYSSRYYYVAIDCEFKDYVPIARDINPEAFNTMVGGIEESYFDQYEIRVGPAVEIENWMLERDLDGSDLDPGVYDEYYDKWKLDQEDVDTSVPFLKGFSTHFSTRVREYGKIVPFEKVEALVKKRVKRLVSYFVAPRLKLLEDPSILYPYGLYSFGSFIPDNYRELERNRKRAYERKAEILELKAELDNKVKRMKTLMEDRSSRKGYLDITFLILTGIKGLFTPKEAKELFAKETLLSTDYFASDFDMLSTYGIIERHGKKGKFKISNETWVQALKKAL